MYLDHSISVLVPTYNEASRISKVLKCFLKSKLIDEIIVIDDGSTDNLSQTVSRISKDIIFLQNKVNLGKASAVVKGIARAKGNLIFMSDADYGNLSLAHIDSSIKFAVKHQLDMLLLPTVNFLDIAGNSVIIFDIIGSYSLLTGLRIVKKSLLVNAHIPKHIGFGLEMFINKLAVTKKWKVDIMAWKSNIIPPTNPFKTKKSGLYSGVQRQILMLKEMSRVGTLQEYLLQYRKIVVEGYHFKKITLQLQNLSQSLFLNDSPFRSQNPK